MGRVGVRACFLTFHSEKKETCKHTKDNHMFCKCCVSFVDVAPVLLSGFLSRCSDPRARCCSAQRSRVVGFVLFMDFADSRTDTDEHYPPQNVQVK